jgi:hypothetical protein
MVFTNPVSLAVRSQLEIVGVARFSNSSSDYNIELQ